ncbi:hypothetical protein FKP32DRAFT_1762474 [Trametes sanguinea]|nr:hypothetical protein FKP32DRAFT_1762474 [Trametes sanguinea]
MKTKSASKRSSKKQPYTDGARKRTIVPRSAAPAGPSAPAGLSASSEIPAYLKDIEPGPNPGNGAVLAREIYEPYVRKTFPGFEIRNDWDIATLTTARVRGTNEEVRAWLDTVWAGEVRALGSEEAVVRLSTKCLNMWIEDTGAKPQPGAKSVFIEPIPDSDYSIRLYPGSISAAEYCMDFVVTATGQPINSPFEYELWAIPHPDAPHLTPLTGRLKSIERAHGIKQEDILPGEERFILRDGLTCLLRRTGKKPVRFTVPTRRRAQVTEAADVLPFPTFIDP